MAGRPGSDRRLQSAAADGQRRPSDVLRQFRLRDPRFPAVRRPLAGDRRAGGGGPAEGQPSRVFGFEQVREAHRLMEANEVKGKMVVVNA
ncbi:zinc-binding dehydrogenase [Nonomuraea rubra]